MNHRQQRQSGNGLGEGEQSFTGEHFAEAGIGVGGGLRRGAKIGIDKKDRGAVLSEHCGQGECEGG